MAIDPLNLILRLEKLFTNPFTVQSFLSLEILIKATINKKYQQLTVKRVEACDLRLHEHSVRFPIIYLD